jgi:hypothetical protein
MHDDDKKSPRIIVAGYGGISSALEQSVLLKERGYSTAVIEHITTDVIDASQYYKIPVNASFTVNGEKFIYNVYVKEVEGIHVIGLKLKDNIRIANKDMERNFGTAALSFVKDLNTNAVLRGIFGTLKGNGAISTNQMEGNLEINHEGVAMVNFVGLQTDINSLFGDENDTSVDAIKKSNFKGSSYITSTAITEENLPDVDQDIKAERLFKISMQEKYYQISISHDKITKEFIEKAVTTKISEGATDIILDITNGFNTADPAMKQKLVAATELIHSHELKAEIKTDISRLSGDNYKGIFNTLFGLGFDGVSIEASKIRDIEKLKAVLNGLKDASRENSVNTVSTMYLENDTVKNQLLKELGTKEGEYEILFITSFDQITGQALVESQKVLTTYNKGYERGIQVSDMNITVSGEKISTLSNMLLKDITKVSVKEIKQTLEAAKLNTELVKHVNSILSGAADNESGTEAVLEAAGFIRGIVEAYCVDQYFKAFDDSSEVVRDLKSFKTGVVSDRKAFGVLLTELFIASPEVFQNTNSTKKFFEKINSDLLKSVNGQKPLLEQKKDAIAFVNTLVQGFKDSKSMPNESSQLQSLQTQLAVIAAVVNDATINKARLDKLADKAKKGTEISASVIENILGAA